MNEVRELVEAFDAAIAAGERCALATIVSVEGSSYRRPGARMLICETGSTTGTISAGCLENDVIEHAKRVIRTGEAKLVEYDNSTTTDEMAWSLGLGCNGIVRVLIEPIGSGSLYIEEMRGSYELPPDAPHAVAATVYQSISSSPDAAVIETGARLFIRDGDDIRFEKLNGSAGAMLDAVRASVNGTTSSGAYSLDIDGSVAKVFIETLRPPVRLVVFGAGHDALPIVELARGMGWQTEVVDPQARPASIERFAIADRVTLVRPEDVGSRVGISPNTMALLMSHNYSHDAELLKFLLESPARYIGVMGPRKRTERMLQEIDSSIQTNRARLHAPVGLNIGADGPREIALSIVAEMQAVLNGRDGGPLRESRGPIRGAASDTDRPGASANGHPRNDINSHRVGAVILAAGASSRMGRPKQTLEFDGTSLLRRAAKAALDGGCSPVIVVTGANAELSRGELDGLDVCEVWNREWETGMASSVAVGIDGLLKVDPNAEATVIMLCDQPHVTADMVARLVSVHSLTTNSIVASRYSEGFGVPAIFGRSHFDELCQLKGTAGAKAVIARNSSEAHFVNFPGAEIDVDTPEDYLRLISGERNPLASNGRRLGKSARTATG